MTATTTKTTTTTSANDDPLHGPMPERALGRTGHNVSLLTMGGVKWDNCISEDEAITLLRRARELGVNTFDTATAYSNGESEKRLGKAVKPFRDEVFLCSKTTKREYDKARAEVEASLERLQTDVIDLYFVHQIDDDADYERIRDRANVLRALEEFREAGHIRFIGISGHWYKHNMQRVIDDYPFDVLLLPAGLFNEAYAYSYLEEIAPKAKDKGMGVMGMKVFGAGRVKHARSIEPYLRYSMHQPIDSMVIGCDSVSQLEQTIRVVKAEPGPLDEAERKRLHEEALAVTQNWDRGEFNWVSHYRKN